MQTRTQKIYISVLTLVLVLHSTPARAEDPRIRLPFPKERSWSNFQADPSDTLKLSKPKDLIFPGAVAELSSLNGKIGRLRAIDEVKEAWHSPRELSDNFLRENSALLGLSQDLSEIRFNSDKLSINDPVFHYDQIFHGIPVANGKISVRLNKERTGVELVVATLHPITNPTAPQLKIDKEVAIVNAVKELDSRLGSKVNTDANHPPHATELIVVKKGTPQPVWKVKINTIAEGSWIVTVDRETGNVLAGANAVVYN